MTIAAGQVCHVYNAGTPQTFAPYDRCTPATLPNVEFDETGCWDVVNSRWIAPCPCTIEVFGTFAWQEVSVGAQAAIIIGKNLPLGTPPSGSNPCEVAGGQDICFYANANPQNQGTMQTRRLQLNAGDYVQAFPTMNCGGTLASGVNADGNTCCYLEIEVKSVR